MLGAGDRSCPTYIAAERRLKEVFDFRSWQEDSETMECCGVLHQRENFACVVSKALPPEGQASDHSLRPRGSTAEDPMKDQDKVQLLALLGSLECSSAVTISSSGQLQPDLKKFHVGMSTSLDACSLRCINFV